VDLIMSNSVSGVSFDCADATEPAQCWADVLGRSVSLRPTADFAAKSDRLTSLGATWVTDVERVGAFDRVAG
jgi:hypothetical protein